ncbi:sigma-70 family RNA polymerase sigma factor [Terrimonas sp. NA20]|uniref:Sigma-70 family RNA polymerase sigma factor n=1 Tax=Terrimonas ginsenosidimutans TaxID=2908004 RepID=A0ABS9KK33_9BACT|nr:sigma-70 family RNA polymerase sigma factor [Terrimonas ginsenosidimutans]MCG2612686.1 sigma-70 family RNA polymerase sigma factor [Terrimonas ginsenosidimutans]
MDKKTRFTKLITQNEGLIIKVASLYTNSQQDQEDLFQEIVFQLWKSFDSFNDQSKISTWMYRVAMNTAIYNLKSIKKKVNTIPIETSAYHLPDEKDKSAEQRIRVLYDSLQILNLLDKGIILLYLEGKNHQEIAEITGISPSNVGTRIGRIKEKLKQQITKTL